MNRPILFRILFVFAVVPSITSAEEASPTLSTRPPVVWNNETFTDHPDGVTHHSFTSAAVGRTVGYCVYLPPGYAESDQRYPVIYYLHGAGGDETHGGQGMAPILTPLIQAGEIPPAICVFPNGGLSSYRDHPDTGINVETMLIQEFIPLIDRTYRTLPQRESRVLTGYSMGGAGTLRLALLHPGLFSAGASWAGGVGGRGSRETPPELRAAALRESKPQVRLLMIVGYKDEAAFAGHAPFVKELMEAEYPFTLRTLADVPHKLGLYYQLSGEQVVRFLLQAIATAPVP